MATLVLGTVGRALGGPIGGLVGSVVGGLVDRSILGGGGTREVGRIGNLAVQSAAYGEPIPIITGRMRVAGNLLWTSGIAEASSRSGGGKRGGTATTTYSYSASLAVGLAGRVIDDIGRIWADGRLIRDTGGQYLTPITMRLHKGTETQAADSLIAACEGSGGTPAYRGIAYVVFEDLPLGDFGNRIPNFTFEVLADTDTSVDVGRAIAAIGRIDGRNVIEAMGAFAPIEGHCAGRSGSVADGVAALLDMTAGSVMPDLRLRAGALCVRGIDSQPLDIAAGDCRAHLAGSTKAQNRQQRLGGDGQAGTVEIAFYDTSRDFQPGLQRVRKGSAPGIDHQAVSCAMSPAQAKSLALSMLMRAQAGRLRSNLRLPWRHVGIAPGTLVRVAGDDIVWRVRAARFESFVVHLEIERADVLAPAVVDGDGGRSLVVAEQPVGETVMRLLDLPPIGSDVPTTPRIWVAAAGASASWRRAPIEVSGDDGASYQVVGVAEGAVVQGKTTSILGAGDTSGWDRHGQVEVELVSGAMWIESRPGAAVLAGGNLALIGDEIVQFAVAETIGERRFRLSELLRGRRGTEAEVGRHDIDDRFVMLDPGTLLPFDPPAEALGRAFRVRPAGPGDSAAPSQSVVVAGAALRPLSPAHLKLDRTPTAIVASWVRRSRTGFGWSDFVDAPIGEDGEAYQVDFTVGDRPARRFRVAEPRCSLPLADWLADGGGDVGVVVSQISAAVGPGRPASAMVHF